MVDHDRIRFDLVPDREPLVGRILTTINHTPMGDFTHEYEIVAGVPDTMLAVVFFRGFVESCPWNDHHGYRGSTAAEREYGRRLLEEWVAKHG